MKYFEEKYGFYFGFIFDIVFNLNLLKVVYFLFLGFIGNEG